MRNVIRSSEVTLLTAVPVPRGVYDTAYEPERTLPCDVLNVSMREVYEAQSRDHYPEYVLDIGHYTNYNDEDTCVFEGKRYSVLRHNVSGDLHMMLTIERERKV